MHRKSVLVACSIIWISLAAVSSFWAAGTYASSRSRSAGTVLGATTDTDLSGVTVPTLTKYAVKKETARPAGILAKEYALYNPESGTFLLKSDEMPQVPIASTTKLMTVYLADIYGTPSDVVTVSREASGITGSLMDLRYKEQITVKNLMYGAMMVSGNDAALSLGEYVGGKLLGNPQATEDEKVERFIDEMNATARSLGMSETHYMDPVGLNDEGHSTAVDLAKLTAVVNERPAIRTMMGTAELTVSSVNGGIQHVMRNSNRITTDGGIGDATNIGGKTGFTNAAGHCLISSAVKDGVTLIAVILHTDYWNNTASAEEARKLLNYGFEQYEWR